MILPRGHIFAGLPAHRFRAILVDPPWYFRCYTADVGSRDPRNHYRTMTCEQLAALPVRDLAAPEGAHLFLWVTGPMLELSFEIIGTWGFRYSGIAFTWVKLKTNLDNPSRFCRSDFHVGLGYTARKNTELCLLARRGNPSRLSKSVRELIIEPRREHSRKPDEIHKRIEQYTAGPYVELFARSSRRGWTTWGAEARKFDLAAPLQEAAE